AAIGQVELMNTYKQIFGLLGIPVAQVLLSRDDIDSRPRYLNARNTLLTLLRSGCLPVVNENDSVATEEIRFGDNDILAALVGELVDAEVVINLTQAPGVLAPDPERPGQERVLSVISEVTEDLARLDRGTLSPGGTGGLASKLEAARATSRYGATMVMARADEEDVLLRLVEGAPLGTVFLPAPQRLARRKRWLASGTPRGALYVDAGAVRALTRQGRSLLPVGIIRVEGAFRAGDLVAVRSPEGQEVGRGLTNYGSEEARRILGTPSARIAEVLGYEGYPEVIHRDNLFVLKPGRRSALEEEPEAPVPGAEP
ncbi:MAG TPA: glutamate 5-kinase, partial [Candidatus Nitrosotenuis sp.]|nr:glutamate 5-kinase [Candidatus Nitrosotenuis sp.]